MSFAGGLRSRSSCTSVPQFTRNKEKTLPVPHQKEGERGKPVGDTKQEPRWKSQNCSRRQCASRTEKQPVTLEAEVLLLFQSQAENEMTVCKISRHASRIRKQISHAPSRSGKGGGRDTTRQGPVAPAQGPLGYAIRSGARRTFDGRWRTFTARTATTTTQLCHRSDRRYSRHNTEIEGARCSGGKRVW